jgi:hypothetical protein
MDIALNHHHRRYRCHKSQYHIRSRRQSERLFGFEQFDGRSQSEAGSAMRTALAAATRQSPAAGPVVVALDLILIDADHRQERQQSLEPEKDERDDVHYPLQSNATHRSP